MILSTNMLCAGPFVVNPLWTRNPQMGTSANSEDPDEMQHYAAFHQRLHFLLRFKQSLGQKYIIIWKILPVTP